MTNPYRNLELLAPAGNMTCLHAAVQAGADAVYLGCEDFNARRGADNFALDNLAQACDYAHLRGVSIYMTVNIAVIADEGSKALELVRQAWRRGVDAFIIQDIGLAREVRRVLPEAKVHISTQMNTHGVDGVKAVAALGASRVTFARELTLLEIAEASAAAHEYGMTAECFGHGALCICYSGQCFMSSLIGGRSANRGMCAQACRLPYSLHNAAVRNALPSPGEHLLSPKDLCSIDTLIELGATGVDSVKIEGRLRTPEYAAAVVTACRAVCAGQPYDEKLVRDIFSRSGFTDGYLTNRNDGKMFGVRTEADAAATRAATPKARELFRRELQRVPVHYELSGGVEDVQIWDCDLANSLSGIEIKATPKRGGYVRGVTVRDCITPRVMLHSVPYNDDGVPAGAPPKLEHCFFERLTLTAEVLDHDRSRHDAAPIEIAGFDKPGYEVEDIVFKDITITKPSVALPLGLCRGVTLSNLACVKE